MINDKIESPWLNIALLLSKQHCAHSDEILFCLSMENKTWAKSDGHKELFRRFAKVLDLDHRKPLF